MKVLVTGGSGFLGTHIVMHLQEKGVDVIVYDKNSSSVYEDLYWNGDVLDIDNLRNAMKGCDCVFHLAALMDLDDCLEHPREAIECNIIGTVNVLSCCVELGVKRILFSSSVYASSSLGGIYGTTKKACELIIEDYHRYYGLEYVCLRYGSLYGPGATSNNRIFRYLESALKEKKIQHSGDGSEIREFIYVDDAAALSVVALDQHTNQTIIVTGTQSISCTQLFVIIEEMLGYPLQVEYSSKGQAHYAITPVTFCNPRLVKKIVSNESIDIGQGLLECLKCMIKEN